MSDLVVSNEIAIRNKWGQFTNRMSLGALTAIKKLETIGVTAAKRAVPVKSGRLRDSIDPVRITSTRTIAITANMPYAMYQEKGTRPHTISGNPDLRFYWQKKGRMYEPASSMGYPGAVSTVTHPGNPATNYLMTAYETMKRRSKYVIRQSYN